MLKFAEKNQLCQRYLNLIYYNAISLQNNLRNNIEETYGEILPHSINKLLIKSQFNEQDIFFDLGSGLGKLAAQFFLNSCLKEVYGIEINPNLHMQALAASLRIQHELPDFYAGGRKLVFLQGDFLQVSFQKANIVLICAPCFSQQSLLSLGKLIQDTQSIHTVLTLRPLPTLQRLPFKEIIRIECSWDTALCYVYSKKT